MSTHWSTVAWRLSLAALLLILAVSVVHVTRKAPAWASAQVAIARTSAIDAIHQEGNATRSAAVGAIADTRRDVLAQVSALRAETLARVDMGIAVATRPLGDISTATMVATASLNKNLAVTAGSVAAISEDLRPVLRAAGIITQQTSDALPMFLDCEFNPDCIFNRFQGTSKAIEKMAQAGAKAAPEVAADTKSIAHSVAGIADDAHREADEFMKPKTFRQKLADWLGVIPRVARVVL